MKLVALIGIISLPSAAFAGVCPDGSYVSGECKLAPNGRFVGGTPTLAPNGAYVGGAPRLAPNGQFIGTGNAGRSTSTKMCPDGSYVVGSRCKMQPDGTYTGE